MTSEPISHGMIYFQRDRIERIRIRTWPVCQYTFPKQSHICKVTQTVVRLSQCLLKFLEWRWLPVTISDLSAVIRVFSYLTTHYESIQRAMPCQKQLI